MLYEMEAAYKPTVVGELDTQNFENFPDVSTWITKVILFRGFLISLLYFVKLNPTFHICSWFF